MLKIKQEINQFDVIIVYLEDYAKSASNTLYTEQTPFSSKSKCGVYNDSYSYFLATCKKIGIKVAFATSKDIIGAGLLQSYWTYNKKWRRNSGQAYAPVIFDKFTPKNKKHEHLYKLLTSPKSIYTFNTKELKNIFTDKLDTYENFKEFAIPTVEIENATDKKILSAKTKLDTILKKHNFKVDFSDGYLMKDKIGFGGFKIFKVNFDTNGVKEIKKNHALDKKNNKPVSYVLQPFINCNTGFEFGKYNGFIDLRVILVGRKIVQTYIRIAKKGDYKCNKHQGGNLVYISLKTVPKDVIAMVKKIIKKLDTKLSLKHSLYALDFIRSNNGNLFFIEGNIRPGIDWDHKKKISEKKAKELIKLIANELKLVR